MSVEQAAERLRRWGVAVENGTRHAHEYGLGSDGACMLASDESTLCDWAIAMNDPTPLSEEILRASGFSVRTDTQTWFASLENGLGLTGANNNTAWVFYRGGHDLGTIETVGDLRRLLSALHIDCPVVVPESGVGNG